MEARHRVAVASLVPLLTLGGGAAQDAAAAQTHRVDLSGSMELNDDEWFRDDNVRYQISGSTTLTHKRPEGAIVVDRCVGGEVRGELHVDLRLHPGDRITVSPFLYLYEGDSCSTTDHDGTGVVKSPLLLNPRGRLSWSGLRASNTAERVGGDWVTADFTVTHAR